MNQIFQILYWLKNHWVLLVLDNNKRFRLIIFQFKYVIQHDMTKNYYIGVSCSSAWGKITRIRT